MKLHNLYVYTNRKEIDSQTRNILIDKCILQNNFHNSIIDRNFQYKIN